jgi:HEAT repeats
MNCARCLFLALGLLLAFGAPVAAGWRVPEGLGVMVRDAKAIGVYEVESVNAEKRVITFKKVEDIRPKLSQRFHLYVPADVKHRTAPGQEASDWLVRSARLGWRIVSFDHQLVYVGGYWLQTWAIREGETPYYKLTEWHAWYGYSFAGSIDELAKACREILEGKEVTVPAFACTPFVLEMVLTHWRGKYDELPLAGLKAGPKITRIPHHELRKPHTKDDPEWDLVVSTGSGRIEQLPGLLKQLGDRDPVVRARAARQIGGIGPRAKEAVPQLARLLKDEQATIRTTAAGAVLLLDSKHAKARTALREAVKDAAPAVRRSAAEWLWMLDRDVGGTIADLVELQRDEDAGVGAVATDALRSFLTAHDLKGLTRDDLRAASRSPDPQCARLATQELAR